MDGISIFCIYESLNYIFSPMSEDDSSSSSTTESEEENLLITGKNCNKNKITEYVKLVVPKYTDMEFQNNFRISRSSVQKIIQQLSKKWTSRKERRPKTSFETALLLTLWSLGNQENFHDISYRFGLSRTTAYSTFLNICHLLYDERQKYIVWPKDDAADETADNFVEFRENPIPGVIGCIDETHISILKPLNDNSVYNRKGCQLFVLQAVCDSQLCFINIYVGRARSKHERKVWTQTPLYKSLKNSSNFIKKEHHLIGNSSYPLDNFLLKPYEDKVNLSLAQIHFNKNLDSTRIIIQKAFSRLKGTFRRLKCLKYLKILNIKTVIIACCVLHNISVLESDEGFYEEQIKENEQHNHESSFQGIVEQSTKRDEISELLYQSFNED